MWLVFKPGTHVANVYLHFVNGNPFWTPSINKAWKGNKTKARKFANECLGIISKHEDNSVGRFTRSN